MKKRNLILLPAVLFLAACSRQKLPEYPATDDGIALMRLDSAAILSAKHDIHHAVLQLKAAEKRLPDVKADSLKFLTYYQIARLNAQSGAYKLALDYYNKALRYTNDVKRNHRLADVYLGQANVYNQMGYRDSALSLVKKAEAFKPRIRKDQCLLIKNLKKRINRHQIISVSPEKDLEFVQIQDRYEVTLAQRNALRQQLVFTYLIIFLLLITGGIIVWFRWRMRKNRQYYQEKVQEMERNIETILHRKDATIAEMKQDIDSKVSAMSQLHQQLSGAPKNVKSVDSIERIKLGIDTLYAIANGENLSQLGRREQQAVHTVMPSIDYALSCILNNPDYALTPKETFFCIMESEGRSDEQKATAFCCSDQAIRSIKSRLKRKLGGEAASSRNWLSTFISSES